MASENASSEKPSSSTRSNIGSSVETLYQQLIGQYRDRYLVIQTLEEFYKSDQKFSPRLCVLEFPHAGPRPTEQFFPDANALKDYWKEDTQPSKGSLYILEDLSTPFIEALGMHFKLDPTVFVAYLYTPDWDLEDNHAAIRPLPSARKEKSFCSLKYYEIVKFHGNPPDKTKSRIQTMANVCREISIAESKKQGVTAMIRRNSAFWCRWHENGAGWNALMIVDPALGKSLQLTEWTTKDKKPEIYDTSPYLHGYVDFSLWPSDPQNQNVDTKNGPTRQSLLDDILYYWKNVSTQAELTKLKVQPSVAALYTNKIIASHWVVMLEHISATLSNLEHQLWVLEDMSRVEDAATRAIKINMDIFGPLLARGNIWRRRLWWYLEDMRWNMEAMTGFSEQNADLFEYQDTLQDFAALKNRLDGCRSRIDSLMRTVIGAGSLIVSQNSLSQADSAARITILATAFLPFSFAASMFTMPNPYAPGQGNFWIYWVVSLILILIIVAIIFTMNWSRQKRDNPLKVGNEDLSHVRMNKSMMLACIVLQCRYHYLSMFLTIYQPPDLTTEPATWHFNIADVRPLTISASARDLAISTSSPKHVSITTVSSDRELVRVLMGNSGRGAGGRKALLRREAPDLGS